MNDTRAGEPRPVQLSYATALADAAGGGPAWVHSTDGVRLVVPPPPPWRRMVGPAVKLAVLTPVVLVLAGLLGSVVFQSVGRAGDNGRFDGVLLCAFPFSLLCVIGGAGMWYGALRRLVRLARRGRQPFVLRLLDKTFELTPAADDPLEPGAWPISAVADVRLDPLNWTLTFRLVSLQIAFRDGEGLVTRVPWPDGSALLPVETELRRALGVDLPVPRTPAHEQPAHA